MNWVNLNTHTNLLTPIQVNYKTNQQMYPNILSFEQNTAFCEGWNRIFTSLMFNKKLKFSIVVMLDRMLLSLSSITFK